MSSVGVSRLSGRPSKEASSGPLRDCGSRDRGSYSGRGVRGEELPPWTEKSRSDPPGLIDPWDYTHGSFSDTCNSTTPCRNPLLLLHLLRTDPGENPHPRAGEVARG